jgi:hypothetical protein
VTPTPRIFISYRRDDSQADTGRIYDRLVARLPPGCVFRDVDSIPAGEDFRQVLTDAVGGCDIVLVVIGPRWLTARGPNGRRLDDPADFVRIEVEAALRLGVRVVPVLVGNAAMPGAAELPPALEQLSFRNARVVRPDPDFHSDMTRLLRELVGDEPPPAPAPKKGLYDDEERASQKRAAQRNQRDKRGIQPRHYVVFTLVMLAGVFAGTFGGLGAGEAIVLALVILAVLFGLSRISQ